MKRTIIFVAACFAFLSGFSQQFEEKKIDVSSFRNISVDIGADFAIQYQSLNHEASNASPQLIELGSNFNLPTANFNINTVLAPGIKVNLETYLSARHHNETWVKGGYLVIDHLPFLPGSDNLMKYLTIKAGVMHPNVGDQQFRRSDNGSILKNAFVGNYIMDDYSTNTGVELMFRNNGFLLLGGINNGTLKPALAAATGTGDAKAYVERNLTDELAFIWKASIDKQLSSDFRLRVSLAGHHQDKTLSGSLHSGDRTGSRYYFVMNKRAGDGTEFDVTKNFTSGNWGPGSFSKDNTLTGNLFVQYAGLEIFGTFQNATGNSLANVKYHFNQLAMEAIYRFGKQEQFYAGSRFNTVNNSESSPEMKVDRLQFAAGWFITGNIGLKLEYVDQKYKNFTTYGDKAGFKGVMLEAGISF